MALQTWTAKTLVTSFAVAACLTLGCKPAKPPPPPPPPEDTKWEAPKQEAKPKKCETLAEKCSAKSSTKARIAKSTFTITPIEKWTYAQTESVLIAQKDKEETSAVMVAVGYEATGAKDDIKNREAAAEAAAKEVGITLSKKKVAWKAPLDTKVAAGLKIGIYEWEGATRKDKKGTLLVFAAPLADNKGGIVGFGFVPDDDTDSDKIVEGLQASIASVALQDADKKDASPAADEKKPDGGKK